MVDDYKNALNNRIRQMRDEMNVPTSSHTIKQAENSPSQSLQHDLTQRREAYENHRANLLDEIAVRQQQVADLETALNAINNALSVYEPVAKAMNATAAGLGKISGR